MTRLLPIRLAFGFLFFWFGLAAWAQVAVPDLSRRVTDLTAPFNPLTRAASDHLPLVMDFEVS